MTVQWLKICRIKAINITIFVHNNNFFPCKIFLSFFSSFVLSRDDFYSDGDELRSL
jgi:hypothetical protein